MKIPWQIPMLYPGEGAVGGVEGARTEPVEASSPLGSSLSGQTSAHRDPQTRNSRVVQAASWNDSCEDRRKQQRRQRTQWVPLDTRLRERRQSPSIRCEI